MYSVPTYIKRGPTRLLPPYLSLYSLFDSVRAIVWYALLPRPCFH